jgi:hypothetical protein
MKALRRLRRGKLEREISRKEAVRLMSMASVDDTPNDRLPNSEE